MLAALVSGGLLLAWPYLAIAEFGPGGSQNGFQWLFSAWNPETDYEHGWLVIPIIAFMLYHARHCIIRAPKRIDWRGLLLFVPACILLMLSFRVGQPRRGHGRPAPDPAGRRLVPSRTPDGQDMRLPVALSGCAFRCLPSSKPR
ncbi:MAG: archaeosortase/exosortase family protein [Collinsella sp.]